MSTFHTATTAATPAAAIPANTDHFSHSATANSLTRPSTAPLIRSMRQPSSLTTSDIPGAQSHSAHRTTKCTPINSSILRSQLRNPLVPDYHLASVEVRPVTPPKFLRDTLDTSDIPYASAYVRQNHLETRTRQLDVTDINRKSPVKPSQNDRRMTVKDINRGAETERNVSENPHVTSKRINSRHTNPLEPTYIIHESTHLQYNNLQQYLHAQLPPPIACESHHFTDSIFASLSPRPLHTHFCSSTTTHPSLNPHTDLTAIGPVTGSQPKPRPPPKPSAYQFSLKTDDLQQSKPKPAVKNTNYNLNSSDIEGAQQGTRKTHLKTTRQQYDWNESVGQIHIDRHVLDQYYQVNAAESKTNEQSLSDDTIQQLFELSLNYRSGLPSPDPTAAGGALSSDKIYYMPGNKEPKALKLFKQLQKQQTKVKTQIRPATAVVMSTSRTPQTEQPKSTQAEADQPKFTPNQTLPLHEHFPALTQNVSKSEEADAVTPHAATPAPLVQATVAAPVASSRPATASSAPHQKRVPSSVRPQSAHPTLLEQKRAEVAAQAYSESAHKQSPVTTVLRGSSFYQTHAARFSVNTNPITNPSGMNYTLVPAQTNPTTAAAIALQHKQNHYQSGAQTARISTSHDSRTQTHRKAQINAHQFSAEHGGASWSSGTDHNYPLHQPQFTHSSATRPASARSDSKNRTGSSFASTQFAVTPRRQQQYLGGTGSSFPIYQSLLGDEAKLSSSSLLEVEMRREEKVKIKAHLNQQKQEDYESVRALR